jgi:hypothetical protein
MLLNIAMLSESPCHHSMARPRVADGSDGLQQWRLAADILNKQGWSFGLGLGVGLTTPHLKKQVRYEKLHKASDLEDGYRWRALVNSVMNLRVL